MSSSLLETVSYESAMKRTVKGLIAPEVVEFSVNPELVPFLVSSTRAMLWVDKCSADGMIKCGVRLRKGIEAEALAAIVERGESAQWGNIHPLTTAGIEACVQHLLNYDLTDVEALVSPRMNLEEVSFGTVPIVRAAWVPLDAVVVLPVDRSFVGTLGVFDAERALAVVHNASRGVAVAWK